jgi:hypothetical protein
MGQYARWLPQISITLLGELWGPNSIGNAPGVHIIMAPCDMMVMSCVT